MDISTSRIEKVDALVIALIGQLLSQAMMILQKKKITIVQSMLRFILSAGIAILVRGIVPSGHYQIPVIWLSGYLAYPICKIIGDNSDKIIRKIVKLFIGKKY